MRYSTHGAMLGERRASVGRVHALVARRGLAARVTLRLVAVLAPCGIATGAAAAGAPALGTVYETGARHPSSAVFV